MNTPIKTPEQEGKSCEGGTVVTPDGPVKESLDPIVEPNDNDVLCGRGGNINSHPGNERFRLLVEKRKRVYLTARFKREKRLIAASIVSEIRSLNPPGRFLAKESKAGDWHDIGDEKARDKTSQALRENAPSIRAEIETEINQQRAEMKRAEEEEAARAGYHQQPWGGYFGSYYGYGHQDYGSHPHAPSTPPHGPQPPHGPPPPQGQHPEHYHQGANDSCWGAGDSPHHYEQQQQQHHHHQQHIISPSHEASSDEARKSGFDTPSFAPSSFSAWTKSFSYGASSTSDHHHHPEGDRRGRPPTTSSGYEKPLSYTPHPPHHPYPVHEHSSNMDHSDGHKRVVHFQDDNDHGAVHYHNGSSSAGRPDYQRPHDDRYGNGFPPAGHDHNAAGEISMSFSPITNHRKPAPNMEGNHHQGEHISSEIQPHVEGQMDFGEVRQESSLLTQVANHILTSWDTTTICAHGSTDADDHSLFGKAPSVDPRNDNSAGNPKEGIESEGQEVELVEMMDYGGQAEETGIREETALAVVDEETRMPPPEAKPRVEIDWPQMGSCHNWIPDSLSASALFGKGSFEDQLTPVGSGDMDATSAQEGFSFGGSIGGDSLCQVFKHDTLGPEHAKEGAIESEVASDSGFGSLGHKALSPIPSWERSFRSKSASSIDTDPSSMSKTSEKNRGGYTSPITAPDEMDI